MVHIVHTITNCTRHTTVAYTQVCFNTSPTYIHPPYPSVLTNYIQTNHNQDSTHANSLLNTNALQVTFLTPQSHFQYIIRVQSNAHVTLHTKILAPFNCSSAPIYTLKRILKIVQTIYLQQLLHSSLIIQPAFNLRFDFLMKNIQNQPPSVVILLSSEISNANHQPIQNNCSRNTIATIA